MTDEEYIADLVHRIHPVIVDLHYFIGKDAMEHIVCEALWLASCDIRAGKTARLESIGQICLDHGTPKMVWDDLITTPVPEENTA